MKTKDLLLIFSLSLLLLFSVCQSSYASGCSSNNGDLSINSTKLSSPLGASASSGVYWPTTAAPVQLRSYSLINCTALLPNTMTTGKTSFFRPGDGNNIDMNRSKVIAGKPYYKIINTASSFANQHGYISFQVQDTNTGTAEIDLSPNIVFYERQPRLSSTQGIIVHNLKIFLDELPTSAIDVSNMSLGMLYLSLETREDNGLIQDQRNAYISFNYSPPPMSTCDVNGLHVTLPTMLSSAFKNSGDEAGQTAFQVTAQCPQHAADTPLLGQMFDSSDLGNNSMILSNSNSASNIALKIYDAANQQPIQMKQSFHYGRFSSTDLPIISKDFYVKYYKINDQPTVAGRVEAQATLNVLYR